MATINSRELVEQIIARNGEAREESVVADGPDGEPAVVKIVEYTNAWGGQSYGLVFEGENTDRYNRPTEFVRNPVTLWERQS